MRNRWFLFSFLNSYRVIIGHSDILCVPILCGYPMDKNRKSPLAISLSDWFFFYRQTNEINVVRYKTQKRKNHHVRYCCYWNIIRDGFISYRTVETQVEQHHEEYQSPKYGARHCRDGRRIDNEHQTRTLGGHVLD